MNFYLKYSFFIDSFFLSFFFISILSNILSEYLQGSDGNGSYSISYALGLIFGISSAYSLSLGIFGKFKNLYELGLILFFIFAIPVCIMLYKGIRSRFEKNEESFSFITAILVILPFYIIIRIILSQSRNITIPRETLNYLNIFIWIYQIFLFFGVFATIYNKFFRSRFAEFEVFKSNKGNARPIRKEKVYKEKIKKERNKKEKNKINIKEERKNNKEEIKKEKENNNKIKIFEKRKNKLKKIIEKEKKNTFKNHKKFEKLLLALMEEIKEQNPHLYDVLKNYINEVIEKDHKRFDKKIQKEPIKKLGYALQELSILNLLNSKVKNFDEIIKFLEEEINNYLSEIIDTINYEIMSIEEILNEVWPIDNIEYIIKNFFFNISNLDFYEKEIVSFLKQKDVQDILKNINKEKLSKILSKYKLMSENYNKLVYELQNSKEMDINQLKTNQVFYNKHIDYIRMCNNTQLAIHYIIEDYQPIRFLIRTILQQINFNIYQYEKIKEYFTKELETYKRIRKEMINRNKKSNKKNKKNKLNRLKKKNNIIGNNNHFSNNNNNNRPPVQK